VVSALVLADSVVVLAARVLNKGLRGCYKEDGFEVVDMAVANAAPDVVDAAAVAGVVDYVAVAVAGTENTGCGLAIAHIAVASVAPGEHILEGRKDG